MPLSLGLTLSLLIKINLVGSQRETGVFGAAFECPNFRVATHIAYKNYFIYRHLMYFW